MAGSLTIGVTGPDRRLPWAWWATRRQLARHGARALRLTPSRPGDLRACAGFVIGGGNDIDPAIYGGDVSQTRNPDPDRDRYELGVLEAADRAGVPVLGICRGAQLLNVHRGGTLVSDLREQRVHTSNRGTLLPRKPVTVLPDTRLAALLGTTQTRVNSLHHQAVAQCGSGLAVVARDRDDIPQAIEGDGAVLRLGVQWHPEYLLQRRDQRRLFGGFVAACRDSARADRG